MSVSLGLECIDVQQHDRVAWLTLNRPESLNAFTPRMGHELLSALDNAQRDPQVRAVVLRGAGRGFSSGADLRQVATWGGDGGADLLAPLREIFHPLILRTRTLAKPVIASVHGGAVGFGCSLALAADIVLADASAYFLLAFASVGLALDGGSSVLVAARAGLGVATELGLLAEPLDAQRAAACGLANHVYADADALAEATAALAGRLAHGAPGSHAAIKQALNRGVLPQLERQLDLEAELQQQRAQSADFVEGVRAFLEKRPASFTGG